MECILVVLLCLTNVLAIWPLPSSYTHGDGNITLWIEHNVQIIYKGRSQASSSRQESYLQVLVSEQSPYSCVNSGSLEDDIVANAVSRTFDSLFNKSFIPWMFHPRFSHYEPDCSASRNMINSITLSLTSSNNTTTLPKASTVDESYSLGISTDGMVNITAASAEGLLYGLTTFTQLFYKHSDGSVYTQLAPVAIVDAPKFSWRGINVDTARTYKPLSLLKRTIDAMSYNKMNRLHWHVTDGQAWPLEISVCPELSDKGAYAYDQKYSPQDVLHLQTYGALLGVEVVIEIDQPGHTSSIAFSHPELIAAFNAQPGWNDVAAEPPSGTLKLNSTCVYDFLDTLFNDLLPRIRQYSRYFHLGGDEVNINAYRLDDTVGTNDSALLQPLMQKFMDRNTAQLIDFGFTPLVWEEMLLNWNLTLPNNTIVQSWLSDRSVSSIVEKGHRVIAGNHQYWYLDCGHGQWLDFRPEVSQQFWPYNDYCSPLKNWRLMYSYDPLMDVADDKAHLVLGGETHIWSEQTDAVNFDMMVWPRACVAAEILWSGAKDVFGHNRSHIDASPRLSEMRERLVARGIGAAPVQMPFCTQNATQCAL